MRATRGGELIHMVPLEVKGDVTAIYPGVTLNLIEVPPDHYVCPDGNIRPEAEAEALWAAHRAHDQRSIDGTAVVLVPEVEPEVAAALARAAKQKPKTP
jgi:hypothetical protein